MQKTWGWKNVYVVWSISVVVFMVIGIFGCNALKQDRKESPTGPAGSAVELGNYAQQAGQSRVVTVNGATHQINGVVSGSVVAGGLYIEINEQSSVGSPVGTDQVMVHLQDVTITLTGLPSGVSAIQVSSNGAEIGQYAVSSGSVTIALTAAQWTQWFGATHYAVVCVAVGEGRVEESMAAVSGRLPSGEVVTFGKGFGSSGGGTACPACSACPAAGTVDPNELPIFDNSAGNGTVTDTRTGLIWLQNANCNGQWDHATQTTWAGNLADGQCGLTDGSTAGQWRLPTVTELQDLIDYSRSSPALPVGHPFTGVASDYYWTSTDYAPITAGAWGVYVNDGDVNAGSTSNALSAWAVR